MSEILIVVKAYPNSKENSLKKENDLFGNILYKVKTTAKAQDNEANVKIIEIISEYFKIGKRNIKIIKGFTSKLKTIMIKLS